MRCTCGASGDEGHVYTCALRSGNRVLVGLPDRLNTAKGALKDYERKVERVRRIVAQRGLADDKAIVDQIVELLGLPVCKHEGAQRDSRGDVWCPDCRQDVS